MRSSTASQAEPNLPASLAEKRGERGAFSSNTIELRLLLIFLATLFLTLQFQYFSLQHQINLNGENAIEVVENRLQTLAVSVEPLIQQQADCNEQVLTSLRSFVFESYRVKEVGLVDMSNIVYCSSNGGQATIQLALEVSERWESSPLHQTLVIENSLLSGVESLIFYFVLETGMGVDVLMPPDLLPEVVSKHNRFGELAFRIQVDGITVKGSDDFDIGSEDILSFSSALYPITITWHTSAHFYFTELLKRSWLGALLGAFLTLTYLYLRSRIDESETLSDAINNGLMLRQFEVHYQPFIDCHTGKPKGFEALLRWKHPKDGMISPGVFIPLAEQTGMIAPLTYFVLDQVDKVIRNQRQWLNDAYISINVSRELLLQSEFTDLLLKRCDENPGLASHLFIEITEESEFSAGELNLATTQMERLRNRGMRIAVDDFGKGYSGLDFICCFPFDMIKIDKVFIHGMIQSETTTKLVKNIIDLAQSLDMQVMAEGVEDAEQVEHLKALGVYLHQGFYFAKPATITTNIARYPETA